MAWTRCRCSGVILPSRRRGVSSVLLDSDDSPFGPLHLGLRESYSEVGGFAHCEGWVTTDHEYFPCVSSDTSGRVTVSNVLNIGADAANRDVKIRVYWWKPLVEIDITSCQE